jgi:hypothetical protein
MLIPKYCRGIVALCIQYLLFLYLISRPIHLSLNLKHVTSGAPQLRTAMSLTVTEDCHAHAANMCTILQLTANLSLRKPAVEEL